MADDEFDALLVEEANRYKPLVERHPIPEIDGVVIFDGEDGRHQYLVRGVRAPMSTTTVVSAVYPKFRPRRIINAYFDRWLWSGNKHSETIEAAETAVEAKRKIAAEWAEAGDIGRNRGSILHKCIEDQLNQVPALYRTTPSGGQVAHHFYAFERWLNSGWAAERKLQPFRVELPVAWRRIDSTVPALCGMIDALFVDDDGDYYLLDWKCSKPFGRDERAYQSRSGYGPASTLPDTKFARYALQLAIYRLMLRQTAGIDVEGRRYLVRFGSDAWPDNEYEAETTWAADFHGVDVAAAELLARLERGDPLLHAQEHASEGEEDDPEELWDADENGNDMATFGMQKLRRRAVLNKRKARD